MPMEFDFETLVKKGAGQPETEPDAGGAGRCRDDQF